MSSSSRSVILKTLFVFISGLCLFDAGIRLQNVPPERVAQDFGVAAQPAVEKPPAPDLSSFRFGSKWGETDFAAWFGKYSAAPSADLERQGVQIAARRRVYLKELIAIDPKLAIASAVPVAVRQQLPASIAKLVEERVTGKGDLVVLGRTEPIGAPAIARRATINDVEYETFVYGVRKSQASARNISMHGIAIDEKLAITDSPLRVFEEGEPIPADKPLAADSCIVSKEPTAPTKDGPRSGAVAAESGDHVYWLCRGGHITAAAEGVAAEEAQFVFSAYANTGNRSVLVMRVDFEDIPGGSATAEGVRTTLNSVAGFIQNNSFGQIHFVEPTVTSALRMPRRSTGYANRDTLLLSDARAAARAAGIEPNNFDFDIVCFPNIGFPWLGQGYVGASGAWIQGNFNAGTTAHELGHNLGVWHANSWTGESSSVDPIGSHEEYGNPFDVMGRTSTFPENHYSANFKFLFGWLPEANIHTVTNSGTYRIYAHDMSSKLPERKYAIRIPVGIIADGEWEDYWIDFRQLLAARFPATQNGAVVQWGDDTGGESASRLIDTTPLTHTMDDAPLAVQQTLVDLNKALSIKPLVKVGSGSEAYLDIEITIDPAPLTELPAALDNADLAFTASGWSGQRATTHDGVDAAESGSTPNNGQSWLETTVQGPGAIHFWWKVSSEANFDFLKLLVDGREVAEISGSVDWRKRGYEVTEGLHTIRWVYQKDASGRGGGDRGWVDQVEFVVGDRPPLINTDPVSVTVGVGGDVQFRVEAGGSGPLAYFWRVARGSGLGATVTEIENGAGAVLTLNNVQLADAGEYSVIVSNMFGTVGSASALLSVMQTVPLEIALDYAESPWAASGIEPWRGQTAVSHDGIDAAQSGKIEDSSACALETAVHGPAILRFWWKVSSESTFDFLQFFLDTELVEEISGEVGWSEKTVMVPNGIHNIRWSYKKDGSDAGGQDMAWVDDVRVENATDIEPIITASPVSQSVGAGGAAMFSVSYFGSDPVQIQWHKNNQPIEGANSALLVIEDVQGASEGNYSAKVSNAFGEAASQPATLTIVDLSIGEALDQMTRPWVTRGDAAWFGQAGVVHDGRDAAQTGRMNDSQSASVETRVKGPASVSFWWKVSSERNFDFLTFEVDAREKLAISGEKAWTFESFELPAGEHAVSWRYAKDSSQAEGEDTAWLDEVVIRSIQPELPRITVEGDNTGITALVSSLPATGKLVLETSTNLTEWTGVSTNQISGSSMFLRRNRVGNGEFLRVRLE